MENTILFRNNGDMIGKKDDLLREFKTYVLQHLNENEFEIAKEVLETITAIDNYPYNPVLIVRDYAMGPMVNGVDREELAEYNEFLLGKGEI